MSNRKTALSTPKTTAGYLDYREDTPLGPLYHRIYIDSPDFQKWLDRGNTFSFDGLFTARAEKRSNGLYWYAFKKDSSGKLKKIYMGQKDKITLEAMRTIAARFRVGDDPLDPDMLKERFGYDLHAVMAYLDNQFVKLYGRSWPWGKLTVDKVGQEYYLRPTNIYLGRYMEAVVAMCNYVLTGKDNAASRRAFQVKRKVG